VFRVSMFPVNFEVGLRAPFARVRILPWSLEKI